MNDDKKRFIEKMTADYAQYAEGELDSLRQQLAESQAALRASTELLRETHNDIKNKKSWRLGWAGFCIRLRTQIAANERLLGGGK